MKKLNHKLDSCCICVESFQLCPPNNLTFFLYSQASKLTTDIQTSYWYKLFCYFWPEARVVMNTACRESTYGDECTNVHGSTATFQQSLSVHYRLMISNCDGLQYVTFLVGSKRMYIRVLPPSPACFNPARQSGTHATYTQCPYYTRNQWGIKWYNHASFFVYISSQLSRIHLPTYYLIQKRNNFTANRHNRMLWFVCEPINNFHLCWLIMFNKSIHYGSYSG